MRFKVMPRGRRWFFTIMSGGNHKVLARSDRYYNDQSSALRAVQRIINDAGAGHIVVAPPNRSKPWYRRAG